MPSQEMKVRSPGRLARGLKSMNRRERVPSPGLWPDTHIFKAYDIRGICPEELDEHAAYQIGLAYANLLQEGPIAVGRDMRLSSPELAYGLIRGITAGGLDVWD